MGRRARATIHESGDLSGSSSFQPFRGKRSEAMLRIVWIVALVVAATARVAAAQEVQKLEPVVVTATKIETPATEIGASVSVVTEDDFRAYHYATVDEALRSEIGVDIRRSGTLGKTSSITIRGANSNQVQVLVDGVRVKRSEERRVGKECRSRWS